MLKALVCLPLVLSLAAPSFAQSPQSEKESKPRSATMKIWIGAGSLVTGASFVWAANQHREFQQPDPFSNRTLTLEGGGWDKGTLAFGLGSAAFGGWFLYRGLKDRSVAKAMPTTTLYPIVGRGGSAALGVARRC